MSNFDGSSLVCNSYKCLMCSVLNLVLPWKIVIVLFLNFVSNLVMGDFEFGKRDHSLVLSYQSSDVEGLAKERFFLINCVYIKWMGLLDEIVIKYQARVPPQLLSIFWWNLGGYSEISRWKSLWHEACQFVLLWFSTYACSINIWYNCFKWVPLRIFLIAFSSFFPYSVIGYFIWLSW